MDHPDHAPEDREHLRRLAAELGLLVTGSSDYHGTNKRVRVGEGGHTSPAAYEALVARADRAGPGRRVSAAPRQRP